MRRSPWRGIYAEIAREMGVTRSAVVQAVRLRNPRMLREVEARVAERRALVERMEGAISTLDDAPRGDSLEQVRTVTRMHSRSAIGSAFGSASKTAKAGRNRRSGSERGDTV